MCEAVEKYVVAEYAKEYAKRICGKGKDDFWVKIYGEYETTVDQAALNACGNSRG